MDCSEALMPINVISEGKGQTFAMETMLEWTLCGGQPLENGQQKFSHKIDVTKDTQMLKVLERDFNDSEREKVSQEDMLFSKILTEETFQSNDGNYVLPLPFKDGIPKLPDNKPQAERRLAQLIRKLKVDEPYKTEYLKFMTDLVQVGHAEEISRSKNDKDGLLRVGGRLNKATCLSYSKKHPMIMPKDTHIT